jgi:hypothetical protein
VLFDPPSHEALRDSPWDELSVRAAIRRIAGDTEDAFDPRDFWSMHPLDDEPGSKQWETLGLAIGASGVVWTLDRLQRDGFVDLSRDWTAVASELQQRYLADPEVDPPLPSLWLGESGMLLVEHGLSPSAGVADRLAACVEANIGNEANEVVWGSPGTMLAAAAMHERTGEGRWKELLERASADLWERWQPDAEGRQLWTQHFAGRDRQCIGAAHGFAGNVRALELAAACTGADTTELRERTTATIAALAFREDSMANWAPQTNAELAGSDGHIRVQWCHGAPGVVIALARLARNDAELAELLLAGGELTWQAGPLRKGPGLCHGTAGNGFTFLKLFELTQNDTWLDRARRFAMHALIQVEDARTNHGHGRHTLWTGDPGVALYAAQCISANAAMPTIDYF